MAVNIRERLRANDRAVLLGGRAVAVMVMLLVPFVVPTFEMGLVVEFLILIVFAASYDLLLGYTGLVSFGHALPYGAGAYFMGIVLAGRPLPLVPTADLGFPAAVVIGIVAVVVVALVTGYLALQLSGVYFAMLTLAFGMVGYLVVFETTEITGGDNGLLIDRPSILGLELADPTTFYYVTLAVVVLGYLAMRRFTNSPTGRVLMSIRENEERARFLGYDTFRYKLFVYTVSGLFAGVAGLLQALYLTIVTPSLMYWETTGDALLVTLIGGMGTLWGAIIGAGFLMGVRELVTGITEGWPIILGVVYVIFVIFVPSGFAGFIRTNRSVRDVIEDLRDFRD